MSLLNCRLGWSVIPAVLAALLLILTAGNADAATPPVVDVDAVVEMALAHDVSAKIAELNLEMARITYQKNIASNLLADSTYNRLTAEMNLRTAQITHANREADVAASAVSRYFALLSQELGVQITRAQRDVARLNLESVIRRANLGTASQLNVLDAEAALGNAELTARQAENALAQQREAFAAMVGLSPANLPELNAELALPEVSIELDEAIDRAYANSTAYVGAQFGLELARLEREQALAEGVAPLDRQAAEIKVQVAALELEQARRSVRQSVVAAFEEVQRTRDALEVEQLQNTLAHESHRLVKQQYEAGLKTESEAIGAEISLAQAEQRHLTALSNYFSAVVALKKLIGEPFSDGNGAQ